MAEGMWADAHPHSHTPCPYRCSTDREARQAAGGHAAGGPSQHSPLLPHSRRPCTADVAVNPPLLPHHAIRSPPPGRPQGCRRTSGLRLPSFPPRALKVSSPPLLFCPISLVAMPTRFALLAPGALQGPGSPRSHAPPMAMARARAKARDRDGDWGLSSPTVSPAPMPSFRMPYLPKLLSILSTHF